MLTLAFPADSDVDARWRAYLRKGHFRVAPPEALGAICDRIREFLGPVRESIVAGAPFDRHWPAGGPWQPAVDRSEEEEADA